MRVLTRRRDARRRRGRRASSRLVPAPAAADLWGADLGPLTSLVGQSMTQIAQYAAQIAAVRVDDRAHGRRW